VDGWHERENRAALLFGRAFEKGLAAYFQKNDPAVALFEEWSKVRDLPLEYTRGDRWERMGRQGIQLLECFAQNDRIRIDDPVRDLQVRFERKLASGDSFVAYIDAIGTVDGQHRLIEWKTTMSEYPEEPVGILSLDPQLVCYSWITGISDVVLVAFLRKRTPQIQYLHAQITDRQRQAFGELVESTVGQIRSGLFSPYGGIRFPHEACLSCPYIGLCLDRPDLVEHHLVRKPGAEHWDWIYQLEA
jgi:hypothetical protein